MILPWCSALALSLFVAGRPGALAGRIWTVGDLNGAPLVSFLSKDARSLPLRRLGRPLSVPPRVTSVVTCGRRQQGRRSRIGAWNGFVPTAASTRGWQSGVDERRRLVLCRELPTQAVPP